MNSTTSVSKTNQEKQRTIRSFYYLQTQSGNHLVLVHHVTDSNSFYTGAYISVSGNLLRPVYDGDIEKKFLESMGREFRKISYKELGQIASKMDDSGQWAMTFRMKDLRLKKNPKDNSYSLVNKKLKKMKKIFPSSETIRFFTMWMINHKKQVMIKIATATRNRSDSRYNKTRNENNNSIVQHDVRSTPNNSNKRNRILKNTAPVKVDIR